MNAVLSRIIAAGGLFLLVFLSGYWISRAGKPYPLIIFTAHKLAALAAIFLIGTAIHAVNRTAPLQPVHWLAIALAALLLAGLIVTGGLISAGSAMPAFVHRLHQVIPYLAVLASAGALYLLFAQAGRLSPG